jgi:hypothetical protein
MYRFDNEMIFEEKLPNSRTQSDPAAVVVEKDSKCLINNAIIENYWVYHRHHVDDYEEERSQPSMKAWHIVKYINSDTSSFINKVNFLPPHTYVRVIKCK